MCEELLCPWTQEACGIWQLYSRVYITARVLYAGFLPPGGGDIIIVITMIACIARLD